MTSSGPCLKDNQAKKFVPDGWNNEWEGIRPKGCLRFLLIETVLFESFQWRLFLKYSCDMRRLRILQIFSKYLQFGGEEYIAEKIEIALAERHEMFRYSGSSEKLLEGDVVEKLQIPINTMYNKKVFEDLKKEQKRNHFDLWVIHNVFPALSPSVYSAAKSLGVPIVHYLHNYRLSCTNGYFLNHGQPCQRCAQGNFLPALATGCWRDSRAISGWMGLVLQKMRRDDIFRQIRRWVTPSLNQKNIHIRMGLPSSRIDVVPYFIEAEEQPSPATPAGGILFLGRLSQEKGVDVLLRAWAQVSAKGRPLWIAGTGPKEDNLKQLAHDLKLTNVHWLGFVPKEKQEALWMQTAFSVIPSVWDEPYPLSFMEAWKNGRPFVGSKTGALKEVLADGNGGLLAEPGSDQDLARQITAYIEEPPKVVTAGAMGHATLLRENSKELWLERFEEVLEKSLTPNMKRNIFLPPSSDTFYACTLFDSGFLAKGIALLNSLKRQGTPFILYVFAMDDLAADYLESLQDPTMVVIRAKEFEGPELLRIKPGRTRSEYYWTCGSSALLYCLEKINLPRCTYLDADLCFFGAPQIVEAQMGADSIGITPHNYAARYDQNRTHGVYCVQYVTIRNDRNGLTALRWWKDRCIEWCYGRVENNLFGDQKYLDDWPERFSGVRVLDAPGIGLAPWNCKNYEIRSEENNEWICRDLSDGKESPLIFFHFHELRFFPDDRIKLVAGGYELSKDIREYLYRPYLRELIKIAANIKSTHPQINPLAIFPPDQRKMVAAKVYARINPHFHDHYVSLREALGV